MGHRKQVKGQKGGQARYSIRNEGGGQDTKREQGKGNRRKLCRRHRR
jgi:hypothetical protein